MKYIRNCENSLLWALVGEDCQYRLGFDTVGGVLAYHAQSLGFQPVFLSCMWRCTLKSWYSGRWRQEDQTSKGILSYIEFKAK